MEVVRRVQAHLQMGSKCPYTYFEQYENKFTSYCKVNFKYMVGLSSGMHHSDPLCASTEENQRKGEGGPEGGRDGKRLRPPNDPDMDDEDDY
jgi:hypothetical protein